MKQRKSFVSNSSSASFIIAGSNIMDVAAAMHGQLMTECLGEDGHPVNDPRLIKDHEYVKTLGERKDVIDGTHGIVFQSCNFETYILAQDGRVIINTCRNHHWDDCWTEDMHVIGHGEDSEVVDSLMSGKFFHSVMGENHSSQKTVMNSLNRQLNL